MTDIASLSLSIDSSSALASARDLDTLARSAGAVAREIRAI